MSDVLCVCGKYNRRGARFCGHCGRPIAVMPQSPFQTGLLTNGIVIANRYRVMGKLGQGGMAAVYQVEDTRLRGKLCAVKEMSDTSLADPQERQRALADFEREALLLAHLSHPNLPRVTDSFEHQSKYYLVMDFVKGSTLEDLLVKRGHPFSEAEVRPWLHQLCNVLAYLHAYNPPIIFRDLKPSNVMLDNYGQIKLIDFGIARHFDAQKTRDTTALGTAGYAAPEQYGKDQSDARADIYALGATLHRLLTGHDPADTPFTLPPISHYNPQVSERLVKTIERCLQFDPNQRWQRVVDIQAAMGGVGAGGIAGGPASTVAPTVAVQRSSRPTTRLVMAAAQLTARQLTIGLGAILLTTMVGIWLWAPWVRTNLPFLWRTLPAFLLAGPTVYAATRRTGLAFITHMAVTVVGWATLWARIGVGTVDYTAFLLGVGLSGLVIEGGLTLLYRSIETTAKPNAWRRELLGYAGVTMLANAVFYFCWRANALINEPGIWLVAALLGALGWFLGDLIKELSKQRSDIENKRIADLGCSRKLLAIVSLTILTVVILILRGSDILHETNITFIHFLLWFLTNWPWLLMLFALLGIAAIKRQNIFKTIHAALDFISGYPLITLVAVAVVSLVISLSATPLGQTIVTSATTHPFTIMVREWLVTNKRWLALIFILILGIILGHDQILAATKHLSHLSHTITPSSTTPQRRARVTVRLPLLSLVPLRHFVDPEQTLILREELNHLKNFTICAEGGRYLLTGYGRFGGTVLISEAMRRARKELLLKGEQSGSLLVLNFKVLENDLTDQNAFDTSHKFQVLVNDINLGVLKTETIHSSNLASLSVPNQAIESLSAPYSEPLDYRLEILQPIDESFFNRSGPLSSLLKFRSRKSVDFSALVSELNKYLNIGEATPRLHKTMSYLVKNTDLPSRVVIVFDKIERLETLEALTRFELLKNERVTVIALARQEAVDHWQHRTQRLGSIRFIEQYIPCLWENYQKVAKTKVDYIDQAIQIRLPNRELPHPEHHLRKNYELFRKHLIYVSRGAMGEVHEELNKPLYRSTSDIGYLQLDNLPDRQKITHNAWLEHVLEYNWDIILGSLVSESTQMDRARIGIYYLLDWIRENSHPIFTRKALQDAAQVLKITISNARYVEYEVIQGLLWVLTQHNYLFFDGSHYYRRWNTQKPPKPRKPFRVKHPVISPYQEHKQFENKGLKFDILVHRHATSPNSLETRVESVANKKRVLFVFAKSEQDNQAQLDEEAKVLENSIDRNRTKIEHISLKDPTVALLQRHLMEHEYHIVHLSGHSDVLGHFLLSDDAGRCKPIPKDGLAKLLSRGGLTECVILNVCNSLDVAESVSMDVPWIIAMNDLISHEAAISFARGFYDAIGLGQNYYEAYKNGIQAIELEWGASNLSGVPEIIDKEEKQL